MNPSALRFARLVLLALLCLAPFTLPAATVTWVGMSGGGDGVTFTDGLNWDTMAAPANGDTVLFTNGAPASITVPDALEIQVLHFGAGSSVTNVSSVMGFRLIGMGGGVTMETNALNSTITAGVELGGVQTFSIGTARTLTVTGILSGSGGLVLTNGGTLILSGANTYSGGTTVRGPGSTLRISSDGNLGTAPGAPAVNITLREDGVLRFDAGIALNANRTIAIGAGGGRLTAQTGTTTFAGSIVDAGLMGDSGTLIKQGAQAIELTGNNSGFTGGIRIDNGRLSVSSDNGIGTGTLTLNGGVFSSTGSGVAGARAFANPLSITANTQIGDTGTRSGALTFNGGVDLGGAGRTVTISSVTTFNAPVGNGTFRKAGGSNVIFTANNTITNFSSTAGTTDLRGNDARFSAVTAVGVTNATLNIGAPVATPDTVVVDRINDTSSIILRDSTLNVRGATNVALGANVETVGAITIGPDRSIITLDTPTGVAGTDLQLNADSLNRTARGTLLLRGDGFGQASGTAGRTRLVLTTAPALSGGDLGTPAAGIVPWLLVGTADNSQGAFGTYDPTVGFRVLTAGEQSTAAIGAGSAGLNVSRSVGPDTVDNVVVNSLNLTGTGTVTINPGQSLGISSGALRIDRNGVITPILTGGTLDFGVAEGIIQTANGVARTNIIASVIEGSGGLTLSGGTSAANILELAGNNNFRGNVVVNSMVLRQGSVGAVNANGLNSLTLHDGTFLLNGFNASLAGLVGDDSSLVRNSNAVSSTLTVRNTAANVYDGRLENGAGAGTLSFVKEGAGSFNLGSGNHTYTGTTTIRHGEVFIDGNSRLTATTGITIEDGGALRLRNVNGNNQGDRLPDAAPISLRGGTLDHDHNANANTDFTETVGAVTAIRGGNTITQDRAASGRTATLTLSSLTRNTGASLNFTGGTGGNLGVDTRNRIVITGGGPAELNGIVVGWTAGANFAFYDEVTDSVRPFTNYVTTTEDLWTGTDNVQLSVPTTGTVNLTGPRTVNSLNLLSTGTTGADPILNLGANSLVIESGMMSLSGSTNFNIDTTGGTITAGNTVNELHIRHEGRVLFVDAPIVDNSGALNLVISGTTGRVELQDPNTFTGNVYVNSGRLDITGANGLAPDGFIQLNGGELRMDNNAAFGNRQVDIYGGQIGVRGTTRTIANNVNVFGDFGFTADTSTTRFLQLDGNVDLQGGRRFISVVNNRRGDITGLISNGGIVASGPGILVIDPLAGAGAANNTFAGGTALFGGTLRVIGSDTINEPLGTGGLALFGGTLQLQTPDVDATFGSGGYATEILGNTTINVDRSGANGSGRTITLGTLTTGPHTTTVTSGNGYNLAFGATTLKGSAIFDVQGGTTTLGAVNDGIWSYTLTKTGAGTLVLNGNADHGGGTTVSGGALQVASGFTHAGSVTVGTGATIGGGGTIGGDLEVTGGTVAPGTSPGVLTVSGGFSLDSATTLAIEINGLGGLGNAGVTYDQLIIGGSVTLGSASLTLDLGTFNGWQLGDVYTVIDSASPLTLDGSLRYMGNALNEGDLIGINNDFAFMASYAGGSGTDFTLTVVVPEPGTVGLMVMGGIAGLAYIIRRRREA